MEHVIGIDLGTTNSVVATTEGQVPSVITNRSGLKLTPSAVALAKNGKRLVGHLARRQAVTNPENTVLAAKRLIGRKWGSEQAETVRGRVGYHLVQGPHDDVRVRLGDETLSLPEVAAAVLTELRLDAEAHFGQPLKKAVITVPAYFNDAQRQATKDAGRIAGLDVLRIINEPTAAAIAYGYGKKVDKKIVVFDLGGGTFDISVLDIHDGVFDVIATGGDTFLGGEDFDQRVVDLLSEPFLQQYGIDLRQDRMALQRLKDAAESARCELSSATKAEVNLPFLVNGPKGPLHLQRSLTRAELEEVTGDLVERCLELCRHTLDEAGLQVGQVDDVLLVGGMTRMPLVQQACRELFGRDPCRNVHPDEVVALGAALQARALAGETGDMLLLDVTPHSLGIHIAGGIFQVLIARNTTVPTTASHLFTTVRDNQTMARIMVLQGESPLADGNELLGEFILSDLPPRPRGEVEIEVVFDISADGLVSVSARDTQTGQRQSITVTATSGLSEDEVERMMEQNADYLLAAKSEAQFERMRRVGESLAKEAARYVDRLEPDASWSLGEREALLRAESLAGRVRRAIQSQDGLALSEALQALDPALQVLKGLEARRQASSG